MAITPCSIPLNLNLTFDKECNKEWLESYLGSLKVLDQVIPPKPLPKKEEGQMASNFPPATREWPRLHLTPDHSVLFDSADITPNKEYLDTTNYSWVSVSVLTSYTIRGTCLFSNDSIIEINTRGLLRTSEHWLFPVFVSSTTSEFALKSLARYHVYMKSDGHPVLSTNISWEHEKRLYFKPDPEFALEYASLLDLNGNTQRAKEVREKYCKPIFIYDPDRIIPQETRNWYVEHGLAPRR